MKKRLLSAFLVLAMVLTLLPSAALAAPNDTEFHINGIQADRKSTRLNSSHLNESRMPSSA